MFNLRNAATKIAVTVIGTGLAAGAAFAGLNAQTVNVTLSDPVIVSGKMLPAGDYKVSEVQQGPATVVMFRNEDGVTEALATTSRNFVQRDDRDYYGAAKKTEITLSQSEDGALHMKDMFIQGDPEAYHFAK